jgi:hypothetical protein
VGLTINDSSAGSAYQGCDVGAGTLTAMNWMTTDATGLYEIEPGEPTTLRIRVFHRDTGEVVTDPAVRLVSAFYDVDDQSVVDSGVRIQGRAQHGGYNYRLVDHRVADADEPHSLEVETSNERVLYRSYWTKGFHPGVSGHVTERRIGPDGTVLAYEREYAGGTLGHGNRHIARDGDRITLTPSAEVTEGKLVIAVYELDD